MTTRPVRGFALVTLLTVSIIGPAWAADESQALLPIERVIWNKAPISLSLPIGSERTVTFPGNVRVGIPPVLADALRTQSAAGTVYWLARKPFPPTRVQIQEVESGRVYLLDLRAESDSAGTVPVEVTVPRSAPADTAARALATNTERADYVSLTRFAAQQMYAPKRLLRNPRGMHRVRLRSAPTLALMRGGAIEATPLASWRGGDLYVTAVKLRNVTRSPIVLDPRALRGQWLAATLQHSRLFAHGDEANTTCVYLISARPFEESL